MSPFDSSIAKSARYYFKILLRTLRIKVIQRSIMQTRTASGCIMRRGIPDMERIPNRLQPYFGHTLRIFRNTTKSNKENVGKCLR